MPTFARGAMAVHKLASGRLRGAVVTGLVFLLVGATLVGTTGSGVMATAGAAVRALAQGQAAEHSSGVQTSPLVRTTYSLVRDSGGEGPKKGAEIILLFSANGKVYLYLADATEALGEPGTYSYQAGKLKLRIDTPDFKINVTFALSLSQAEVKMPFQIFSAKTGSSLWKRQPLAIDEGIYAVFNAEGNASTRNPTLEQAAGDAYAYAEAWMAAGSASASAVAPDQATRAEDPHVLTQSSKGSAPSSGGCSSGGANCIARVETLGDDIKVTYKDGASVVLDLYSWDPYGRSAPLQDSPLASDPRVYLDPWVHPDGRFDPTNKTAVLISPFAYTVLPWPAHQSLEQTSDINKMASVLHSRGYKVKELLGAASVKEIVDALKPGPGYVLFSSHGDNDGDLDTGETVMSKATKGVGTVEADITQESKRLAKEGLKSLVDYHAQGGFPATFVLSVQDCSFLLELVTSACKRTVMLTPLFWAWLTRDEHTSFAESLVFISACLTDSTPDLRNAIDAKAYFAFREEVATTLATAVELYLVESLARPTHSPEEAFYNMRRIDHSHMMIYKEDHVFDKVIGNLSGIGLTYNLDAWGWNGTTLLDYRRSGWLSMKVDLGQVWWLLYAARWDTNTKDGAAALTRCLNTYWINGEPGGLADEFCNSADAGLPANKERLRDDVAYAIYLLDGEAPPGFPPDETVPRWTMDDSR
ncbi:MAG: hypothetical protein WAV54_03620 [Acidimicrobiales bacterium]